MKMINCKVTVSRTLDLDEIISGEGFNFNHVVDLRCGDELQARPIEERVMKKLRNYFIEYEQMPMTNGKSGPCEEVRLCEDLNEMGGSILVVTDDIPYVASLCNLYDIPFTSREFYVVETGKGDIVKSVTPELATPAARQTVRFGTFGS